MSDDLKNRGPQDRNQINVNESWELDYWSDKLGVSKDRLKAAVQSVGPAVEEVKAELEQ